MAKRPQIGLSPPDEVKQWLTRFGADYRASNTCMGLAGFVALRCASDLDRNHLLTVAYMLDTDQIIWSDVENYARLDKVERAAMLDRWKSEGGTVKYRDAKAASAVLAASARRRKQ